MPGRILIIDDEANLRHSFTRILKLNGWEVTTAADGAEALDRLAGGSYDLAFLDIRLPGTNGLDLLKEIHRLYPPLPVILFTAYASVESAVAAVRLGAIDYLIKPIDPDTLVARTRVVLAERAVERRRAEIRAQIEALQAELAQLERSLALPEAPPGPPRSYSDRFLKRSRLILDLQSRRATLGEQVLALPPAAFDYLVVLARHAPDVVPFQTLVAEAQGFQTDRREASELAKWHIHELRDCLGPDPSEQVLNVRGVGYRLVID